MSNDELFEELRAIGLDPRRYAIAGSGPLGVRGIRQINDVDLLCDDGLFAELERTYGRHEGAVSISSTIEAFGSSSFPRDPDVPTVAEQIASAEMIDGLPFVSLDAVLAVKRSKRRPKDLEDIEALRAWLEQRSAAP